MQWKLIQLRKENNLKQADMAEVLGISTNSYGQKERGERTFTQDEMFFLSKFFRKMIQDIFLPRKSPNRKQKEEV